MTHHWWETHRRQARLAAIWLLAALALLRLSYEFQRLLFDPQGANDLRRFHDWTHLWFSGQEMWLGYPPASFLMFWPLLGWLSGTPARWLWAVTSVAMVIWLVRMIVSELHLKTRMERWSVLLYILAVYSTGITIGNGQIILHLLPPLLIGIVWLYQQPRRWNHDLIISVLLLFALIKPSVSVPFFFIVLFSSPRILSYVAVGYIALTFWAVGWPPSGNTGLGKRR